MQISRLRRKNSMESDIGYFAVNIVFNGEPVEPLEKIV